MLNSMQAPSLIKIPARGSKKNLLRVIGLLLMLHRTFLSPHAPEEHRQHLLCSLPLVQLAIRFVIASLILAVVKM